MVGCNINRSSPFCRIVVRERRIFTQSLPQIIVEECPQFLGNRSPSFTWLCLCPSKTMLKFLKSTLKSILALPSQLKSLNKLNNLSDSEQELIGENYQLIRENVKLRRENRRLIADNRRLNRKYQALLAQENQVAQLFDAEDVETIAQSLREFPETEEYFEWEIDDT